MALFLLPTGQANLRIVTEVNGLLLTAPSSSIIATIAEAPLAQARPGSSLDITGDVIAFGGGSPMRVLLSGKAALPDTPLADGAVITIAHGNNLLERIVRKDESVPFKTVNKGTGAFVRLARAGVPGQQAVYHGVLSHKQAAVVTTAEARDAVLQHSSAAKQGEKLAALTFDDGPGRWTQGVLDALAAKKVPA
ncbi:MAG: polysaccharide deacetylase family protein, partial [Actinobacteria bacterium]|nr:polysaccharide deacetylase family protein [Actinomycetota bacterium]